ncbi:endonuclease [Marinifilum caeruleilacunae]|uniref:Endonuclease n=1 Tax=Marinifilum caeruleilacunae TaxID=2499076 RepID=A0ABX1WZ86_9BACT|nr:endonuclease [Marinifilum caeruleilacunae]NOU61337.1 endonuclease [Marinifilum caeruleilacunae]
MKVGIIGIFLIFITWLAPGQTVLEGSEVSKRGDLRLMFYNLENCFDCFDDSLKLDNEFLPTGERHWTWDKYQRKLNRISKVIMAAGGWEFPDLIGLCEIENRFVLDGIFAHGRLNKIGYKMLHKESPDRRGIDVALLYQPEIFQPLHTHFIPLIYPNEKESTTREILYVKAKLHSSDTLHVFVNHWPSRWGGQLKSEHKRLAAARLLRQKVDSIYQESPKAKLLIMGDFNDYPENESIKSVLNATAVSGKIKKQQLYNLADGFVRKGSIGSHKYQGKWGMLDQFIVSGNLLDKSAVLYCKPDGMSVFAPDYLLEKDETYFGVKPFRTFVGYRYHGGFSDHLPVILDFWRK